MARYFDASASARIDTRAYERGLRRYLGRMSADVRKAVERTGTDVQNEARRLAPVDTGRLRSSIVARRTNGRGVGYEVGTNVNYARDVEFGTAPHVITPKNGKALYWPGAAHPVAKVNHPGTKPRPFLRPAVERTEFFFRRNLEQLRGR
ncbi:HK97 gp10 family phage protein [Streptomyces piniterrae]|uniref:HK97 gp10 family phage protein n=1 Tax=Streptomyces piniterrae TaxID=2571125 RepID=A0A4U0NMF9_9ACTN|nr:HK97-gp10 family putative phage morphogenesis protein [Streptomyces piniterrae]TJZ55611.1 HK97 gp10 family phage protein [Streptomyces piniterrae]